MDLLKTSALNAIAVAIRIATGLVLNKIISIFVGPSGYALIGQFQNIVNIGTAVASGGIYAGVTKYTAEYFDQEDKRRALWRTAFIISSACTLPVALGIIAFRGWLATLFLHDAQYSTVLVWFSLTLIFVVWNGLLLAVLNGLKQLRQFVSINISGSLISLAVTGTLAANFGLYGALIAFVVNQAIVFLAALLICRKAIRPSVARLRATFDPVSAKALSKFTAMALVSAAVVPGSQILIREHLGEQFGWNAAGHWQAVTKVSDIYMMLVMSTLSFYYLPRLSEIRNGKELKREILIAYKFLLPVAMLSALAIYLLREFITRTLFSESFLPMAPLFFWQVIGDVMKIGSWILSYLMVARAMTRVFLVTEVVFSGSYVGLTYLLTGIFGMQGAMMAYAANYLFYWLAMSWVGYKVYRSMAVEC